jgi:nicotinamide phosphoribosyltransferase
MRQTENGLPYSHLGDSQMNYNAILDTDSYKASHFVQYPPGTEYVYSYVESRGGEFDFTVFFGLQYFLKRYLSQPITDEDIDEAELLFKAHGEPFNREGWEIILREYDGLIPLEIRAVPEGTVVLTKNVLATVVNTDPRLPWLTSYFETALLRSIWYATTVATLSKTCKNIIAYAMSESCDNMDGLPFKLHDFGGRGVSSLESAGLGGAAHLVNFLGTDTVPALVLANKYYDAPIDSIGFSIPAAEHSTITSWGRDGEEDAYRNMLRQFGGTFPLIAVVSDSWSIYEAVENIWGEKLRDEVIASGSVVVVRPDSGEPAEVVVDSLKRLDAKYGSVINSKGYKVLHNVRVIQGDGIKLESLPVIINAVLEAGYSLDNVAFGMGGGLLQQVNRDTQKFAMKCSAIRVNGEWRDVYKDPVTDSGKRSKRGRLALIRGEWDFRTVRWAEGVDDCMRVVYHNGELINTLTFEEVRSNGM